MRHQRSRLRLKQKPAHAKMLERNLVTSLLLYESIRTTKKRAKVVQPVIDSLIHYAKSHPPHVAVRYVNRVVTDKNAGRKIMEVYCERYADRSSGLSRITPVGARSGDGAELVDLVLIDAVLTKQEEVKEKKPASSSASASAKATADKKAMADKKEEKPKAEKAETTETKPKEESKKKTVTKKKES